MQPLSPVPHQHQSLPAFRPVLLIHFFFLLACAPRASAFPARDDAGQTGKTQQITSPGQVPEGLVKSDWQSIRAAYEAGRHAIQPVAGGGWQARNPGQQWTITFDQRGFLSTPKDHGWQWGLELQSYGFGENQRAISGTPEVRTAGGRLSYQWDATVQEWWVNDQRGLEHGFVVRERPETQASEPSLLSFTLSTRGQLTPSVTAGSVSFQNEAGITVVNYAGLKVWDADGKVLTSRFEPAGAKSFRLLVDERGARYPLTIDPIAQQAYLKASQVTPGDNFGSSVAVSGDTVVVGADLEDSSSTGINSTPNESADNAGAAYVFVRNGTTWSQQAYLKAGNAQANDNFGSSVAVSGDTIVVGAWSEDSSTTGINTAPNEGATDAGAAYVFVRTGTAWSQQAYLKAGNTGANDSFGTSVAVSGDTVVIGAAGEGSSATGINSTPNEGANYSGAAYVFVRSGTAWSQQAYLKASQVSINDLFGSSVAVSGDTVVVGAEFEDSSTTGINSTPNEGTGEAGAAYVFVRTGTVWSQQAYLKAHQVTTGDDFGYSVAVSGDTVVVGAPFEDSSTAGINSTPDEGTLDAGAAYVFVRSGTTWSQQAYLKASQVSASDQFGYSVSVSGNTVVAGARLEDSSTTGVNSTPNEESGSSGAAYMFERSGATWRQLAYLKASRVAAGDLFGGSVAVSGDIVVVGANKEDSSTTGINSTPDDGATDAGAAFIFLATPGTADYTVTTTGSQIVVTDSSGNGDTLTVSEPSAGNIQFAAAGRTFTVNGGANFTGSSGPVSMAGVTGIIVNAAAGNDTINTGAFTGQCPSLTLNGGTGDDTVNLNGDITFASGASLDLDLQNDDAAPGVDTVNFASSANLLFAGTGTATIRCSRNVFVDSGAGLDVVDGALTVEANQQAVPTQGAFPGVELRGPLRSLGAGTVTVLGRGGNDAGGIQHGILITSSPGIAGGTTGRVTVTGTAGPTAGYSNRGVQLHGVGSSITSTGAPIEVTGTGSGAAGVGVFCNDGTSIAAGGTGPVKVTGTGSSDSSYGVVLQGPGARVAAGGAVAITGVSAGGLAILIQQGAAVSSDDSATLLGDSMVFDATATVTAPSFVELNAITPGTGIDLGSTADTAAGPLGLSDAELDRVTTTMLVVGKINGAPITLTGVISPQNYPLLALQANAVIAATGGFAARLGPSSLLYDRMSIAGNLTIQSGAVLNLSAAGGFVPANGQTFTIIDKDRFGPISGEFDGKPEGALLPGFLGSGLPAAVSYRGGVRGNAVVIALGNLPPVAPPQTFARAAGQSLTISLGALLAACSDPNTNTILVLTGTGPSSAGASILRSTYELNYIPVSDVDDYFTYTIGDQSGGIATGTIFVPVVPAKGRATGIVAAPGGQVTASFLGVPGVTYTLQCSSDLSTWCNAGAVFAPASGAITFSEPYTPGSRFYRLKRP